MKLPDSHISDQRLLLDMEGELSPSEAKLVGAHLSGCWTCRARRRELESAVAEFVRLHKTEGEPELPPAAGPRALLKARLAELSEADAAPAASFSFARILTAAGAVLAVLALGVVVTRLAVNRDGRPGPGAYYLPDVRLTPGATVLLNRAVVCSQPGEANRAVPAALRRQVFQEYGIPKADPRAYEVDYLVTPALGGADDIHNLWPHSHAATWNAHVKDALEDRLRELVCDGSLDLTEAQREIATNWISAYKKYFHTDEPLPQHRRWSDSGR